jgi:hypothetical protein
MSDIKSLTRDKSYCVKFRTISPQSILHILPNRIGSPITRSFNDLTEDKYVVPNTTSERKQFSFIDNKIPQV